MIVLLDAGPLGMVSNPRANPEALRWLSGLFDNHRVVIPEIADYEVRRKLLHRDKQMGIHRLDALRISLEYLPITSAAMQQAAQFWAESRRRGLPTCSKDALDADAILAAQAATHPDVGTDTVVIATTNVGHLSQFVLAKLWHEIK